MSGDPAGKQRQKSTVGGLFGGYGYAAVFFFSLFFCFLLFSACFITVLFRSKVCHLFEIESVYSIDDANSM